MPEVNVQPFSLLTNGKQAKWRAVQLGGIPGLSAAASAAPDPKPLALRPHCRGQIAVGTSDSVNQSQLCTPFPRTTVSGAGWVQLEEDLPLSTKPSGTLQSLFWNSAQVLHTAVQPSPSSTFRKCYRFLADTWGSAPSRG